MLVEKVIDLLREASVGSRHLDALVAQAFGWRKVARQITNEQTGEVQGRTLWLIPNSDNPGRVPHYTSNLEAAYLLIQQAHPSAVSGFSWDAGTVVAQVGEKGPRASAATPALALCLATLMTFTKESRSR